jgi:hypothetical protein
MIELPKGGVVIRTLLGNLQYGMPPETVKDTFLIEGGVPEYYIIPSQKFDWQDGINFMEFEFPVYCNFFIKKKVKTKLICTEETKKKIEIIFQETLLGPKDLSKFSNDFWENYKGIPDIEKELRHFAVNPFNPSQKLTLDLFIDFIIFDKKMKAELSDTIQVNEEEYLELIEKGLIELNGKYNLKRKFVKKKYFWNIIN